MAASSQAVTAKYMLSYKCVRVCLHAKKAQSQQTSGPCQKLAGRTQLEGDSNQPNLRQSGHQINNDNK